jgi:hypothetical protein
VDGVIFEVVWKMVVLALGLHLIDKMG